MPISILLIPLAGILLSILAGLYKKSWTRWISFFMCVLFNVLLVKAWMILGSEDIRYALSGWPAPLGIELRLDSLSLLIISIVGLIAIFSACFTLGSKLHPWPVDVLSQTLLFGLSGMALTADLFNLYVFLEITSLAAYALLAHGNKRAALSAFRYLILGSVGASLYLLGVGVIYFLTGSLNMIDVAVRIQALSSVPTQGIFFATVLMASGLLLKLGVFPLHRWLPNVYSNSDPIISSLIPPIMTKVNIYILLRIFLSVTNQAPYVMIGWLSAISIVFGALMAYQQDSPRKLLAYSSISQLGYLGLGLACVSSWGITGLLTHFLHHALATSALFILVSTTFTGPISRWLRLCIMLLCGFSIVGLPPTLGFFSKWYLVLATFEAGQYVWLFMIALGSLLSIGYMLKLAQLTEKYPLPFNINAWLPASIAATALLLLGILNVPLNQHAIQPAVKQVIQEVM